MKALKISTNTQLKSVSFKMMKEPFKTSSTWKVLVLK